MIERGVREKCWLAGSHIRDYIPSISLLRYSRDSCTRRHTKLLRVSVRATRHLLYHVEQSAYDGRPVVNRMALTYVTNPRMSSSRLYPRKNEAVNRAKLHPPKNKRAFSETDRLIPGRRARQTERGHIYPGVVFLIPPKSRHTHWLRLFPENTERT